MLLWAEFSIQFLIPIIFLVIWAINQVFGRAEAPPPPVRERIGPRPVPPPGQQRSGPSRAPQTGSRAPSRQAPGPQQGRASTRSRADTRSGSQGTIEEIDPPQRKVGDSNRVPRPVPADIQEVYAFYDDHRVASRDARSMMDLSGEIESDRVRLSHTDDTFDGKSGLSLWANTVQGGADPTKLREAVLMSEILSPPLGAQRLRTIRSPGPPPPQATDSPGEPSEPSEPESGPPQAES